VLKIYYWKNSEKKSLSVCEGGRYVLKHVKVRKLLVFLIVFVLVMSQMAIAPATPVAAVAATTTATTSKNIVVYFPNWGTYNAAHSSITVGQIPWDKVTVVNHAFFEVDSSFKLASTDKFADFDKSFTHSEGWDTNQLRGHMGEYKYYKSQYPNVKVLISVGGWTRGNNFHAMADSSSTRAVFINSVVDFLKQYPFIDGIDLDWEFPGIDRKPDSSDQYDKGCPGGPEDKQNFTALLREIREAYKNNGLSDKMLTIAAPAGYDKAQYQEPDVYAQYLDFLNVMTYDIHGAWETTTNHQAAIYPNPNDPSDTSPIDIKNRYNTDSAMKLYRDTYNIPASKLNVGTPFYSRGWKNVVNNGGSLPGLFATAKGAPIGTWDNPQSPGGQNSYFKMKQLEQTPGYIKYRDPIAKVPYLYNASEGIMYTYEDEESLTERCNYVLNNGFGGMIVWEISGDDPNGFPMTTLLADKLANGGGTPTSTPTITPTVTPAPTSTPTPTPTDSSYPAWDRSKIYVGGNMVSHNSKVYKAKWWTQGEEPGVAQVWELVTAAPTPTTTPGPTPTTTPRPTLTATPTPTLTPTPTPIDSSYPAWDRGKVYVGGDMVSYNSKVYKAKWWTQGEEPGVAQVWELVTAAPTPTTKPGPTPTPTPRPTQTPGTGERMYVGYTSTWNTSINDLAPANIPNYFTHVNLAFAKPNTAYQKGSYEFDQAVTGFEFVEGATTNNGQKKFTAQQVQDLRNNIAALKARGTQVWVSIGGWAYSQGSSWSDFNATRVVDLALDLGASGIDVDWEAEGASCNKQTADTFGCTTDSEIIGIITSLYNEIHSRGANLGISVAGWSTGAYYVKGSPFEEGKVQWGSPFGGVMYRVVKDHGDKIDHINLMSYDGGEYYDPREGYESYRAIYNGPINMGMEIAPEGAGGAVLKLKAEPGTVYDAEMLTGQNNMATKYYNVETMVNYIKNNGRPYDGFMIWQIWKERVNAPAPQGAATVNSASQYVCQNLPLSGDASQTVPNLPKY
jgi:chitinase